MALSYFTQEIRGAEELSVSNGVAGGVHQIGSVGTGTIPNLITIGSRVFFTVAGGDPEELWTSDGTTPSELAQPESLPVGFNPNLTNVNGTLYFEANDGDAWR